MKRVGILWLCVLLVLGGCQKANLSAASSGEDQIDPAQAEPIKESEISWIKDKKYLDVLYMDWQSTAQLSTQGQRVILASNNGRYMISFGLDGNEIRFQFPNESLDYEINYERRSADLSIELIAEGDKLIWNAVLTTKEGNAYPIALEPSSRTVVDNEEGSPTKGKRMNFVAGLQERCTNKLIDAYNKANMQMLMIRTLKEQILLVKNGMDPAQCINASEIERGNFDPLEHLSEYPESLGELNPSWITGFPVSYFNFNEEEYIFIEEASKLQKTLASLLYVKEGFESAESMDFEQLLLGMNLLCRGYVCVSHECTMTSNGKMEEIYLDYSGFEGYYYIVLNAEANAFAKRLIGIDDAYTESDEKMLENGMMYSAKVKGYISALREGDGPSIYPGIIVLDQTSEGNRIDITMVKYDVEYRNGETYAGGILLPHSSDVNENINAAAIDIIKENIDSMGKWHVVLEDTGDEEVYRIVSMELV